MKVARRRISGEGDLEKELNRPLGATWFPGVDAASPGAVDAARFDEAATGAAARAGDLDAIECHLRGSARIGGAESGLDLIPPRICTRHWRQVYLEAMAAGVQLSGDAAGDELT
jgi:hypothetical protein